MIIALFQLTRPLRGATHNPELLPAGHCYFNSHAPCGARLALFEVVLSSSDISTHTPLAGRDIDSCYNQYPSLVFQLTRPLRGATVFVQRLGSVCTNFNSHAPCGARPWCDLFYMAAVDFNSHAPCGARPKIPKNNLNLSLFQLTRPLRGATQSRSL